MKLFKSKYFLLFLGSVLFLLLVCVNTFQTHNISDLAQTTSQKLNSKYNELKSASEKVKINPAEDLPTLYVDHQIGVYVYKKNSLVYWNNSQIPVPVKFNNEFYSNLTTLKNGYYLSYSTKNNEDLIVTLCPIKAKYDLQNDYLKNSFADWLSLPPDIDLKLTNINGADVTINNVCLFSLVGNETSYRSNSVIMTLTLLFFCGMICYLLFVIVQIKNAPFSVINFAQIGFLFFARYLMLHFKWPDFLYRGDLYNIRLFGNARSYFNEYLGDVALNSILLIWLSIACYYWLKNAQQKNTRMIFVGITSVLLLTNLTFHHHIFYSIITNSTISFDFLNVLNLSVYTYIALIPIVLVNISILILSYILFKYAIKNSKRSILFYIATIISITLISTLVLPYLMSSKILPYHFWIERWWYILIGLLVLTVAYLRIEKNILAVGGLLLLVAMISSAILNFYISKNQNQDSEVLSYDLIKRQDNVLESEFFNLSKKIEKSEQLKALSLFVDYNGDKEFLQLLKQNFFFGYFDRYNIEFSMFDENRKPLIKNTQSFLLDENYFEDQIHNKSIKTSSPQFIFY